MVIRSVCCRHDLTNEGLPGLPYFAYQSSGCSSLHSLSRTARRYCSGRPLCCSVVAKRSGERHTGWCIYSLLFGRKSRFFSRQLTTYDILSHRSCRSGHRATNRPLTTSRRKERAPSKPTPSGCCGPRTTCIRPRGMTTWSSC